MVVAELTQQNIALKHLKLVGVFLECCRDEMYYQDEFKVAEAELASIVDSIEASTFCWQFDHSSFYLHRAPK